MACQVLVAKPAALADVLMLRMIYFTSLMEALYPWSDGSGRRLRAKLDARGQYGLADLRRRRQRRRWGMRCGGLEDEDGIGGARACP